MNIGLLMRRLRLVADRLAVPEDGFETGYRAALADIEAVVSRRVPADRLQLWRSAVAGRRRCYFPGKSDKRKLLIEEM